MKILVFVFLFISLAGAKSSGENSLIKNNRGSFLPPAVTGNLAELNKILFTDMATQNNDLKRVKYFLVNGETNLAKMHLSKVAFTQTKLKPIIFRYLGILSFMENDFDKSLEYLNLKELQGIPHYQKICTLKILNLIVLNKTRELSLEWPRCQEENLNHFSSSHFEWLNVLVSLKLTPLEGITKKPFKGIKIISFDNDQIKMILKMALYLNQEKIIEEQLTELTIEQYEDEEIRELLGQINFRLGQFKKSYRFVEGLDSPNAENIKGNLYILRKNMNWPMRSSSLPCKKNKILKMPWKECCHLPGFWVIGRREQKSRKE